MSRLLLAVPLALAMLVVGCKTANKPAQAADSGVAPAVACNKCQVTWVKIPRVEKGRAVAYTTHKSMVCPDCKSAAENFFATGKLAHTCKTCGPEAMEICAQH